MTVGFKNIFYQLADKNVQEESYCCTPSIHCSAGKMFKFYIKSFVVVAKELSGQLSFVRRYDIGDR